MAREAARRKEKHVHTLIVTGSDEARSDAFCCGDDSPEPPCIYRKLKIRRAGPPLHLHEGDGFSAPRNKIHFPPRCLHASGEDSPALEPQIPRSQRLAPPAPTFALSTIHLSSMARA